MGDKIRTIQNLEIIKSDIENSLIFVKGSIPGSKNTFVLIQKTSKNVKRSTTIEKIDKLKAQESKIKPTKKQVSKEKIEKKLEPQKETKKSK